MSDILLRLEGLCKYYTGSQSVVMGLNQINLTFRRGEFVAITGESGSGKSTLAHVIGGILPYESGEMLFAGKPTSHYDGTDYERYRRDHISFISQNYGILVNCTVLENVVSALRLSGMGRREAMKKAKAMLKDVELWRYRRRRAAKLSSGQKQRLSIARALAKPAPILIADEPTGNLDPENSAKVIQLLKRAARDRLVLLITHEFAEAEETATRHIVLQDGQIVMDAPLRPAEEPAATEPPRKKKKSQHLAPYVARLQRKGRPVWSSLVLLFFALTGFAVFAFLGTLIIHLDDTSTRIYDDSAFRNGSKTRIAAIRLDQQPMTQEDYDTILGLQYVQALERHGYVADVNYGYSEETGLETTYITQNVGPWDAPIMEFYSESNLNENAPFLQTVPLLAGGREFLTAGRLPQNHLEVVAAGGEELIGTVSRVIVHDMVSWNRSAKLVLEVTVTGVTDYGSGYYFHEDLGRMFTHCQVYGETNFFYLPASDLTGDLARFSASTYDRFHALGYPGLNVTTGDYLPGEKPTEFQQYGLTLLPDELEVPSTDPSYIPPTHASLLNRYVEVSKEAFDAITWQQNSDQVSLTISDYAYTDRVLAALQEAGYIAISPFQNGSTQIDSQLAAERYQTLGICGGALLMVILLQILVVRALFNTQTEGYKLLSNIGLTCSTANRSVFLQVLRFALMGEILAAGGIWLCHYFAVERIEFVLRYLPPVYMAGVVLVHLAAAVISAVWISRAVTRQVFPLAQKQFDLTLCDEEEAV